MALVDSKKQFIWANIGAAGNNHDSTVFQSTKLWAKIKNGVKIPPNVQIVNNVEVSPAIIGDGAFPLCS